MAETDPVEIVVEIVDKFSDELRELRQELERIDKKNIRPDFDISDEGDIESIQAQLEALRKSIDADVDVDLDGVASAEAQLDTLARDRTVDIDTDGDILSGEQLSALRNISNQTIEDVADENLFFRDFDTNQRGVPDIGGDDAASDFMQRMQQHRRRAMEAVDATPPMDAHMPAGVTEAFGDFGIMDDDGFGVMGDRRMGDIDAGGFDFFDSGILGRLGGDRDLIDMDHVPDSVDIHTSQLVEDFREMIPSMRTWMNMVAAVIPMIITLVGGLVGLAAALGAVATAGAAIIGVGLLGWGDSFSESISRAQKEAQQMGSEIFGVLQPAANQFQPILSDWMEGAPHQMQQLVDPLQRMTVFRDELEMIGGGFVEWIADVLNAMAALDDQIGFVLGRSGDAAGSMIIQFLSQMVTDVYKNFDAYSDLVGIFIEFIVILFNVAQTISFALAQFRPLVDIVAFAASALNNQFIVALLTALGAVLLLEGALSALFIAHSKVIGATIASSMATIKNYIPSIIKAANATWSWVTAVTGLQAALRGLLVATGIGALLVGGGLLVQGAMNSMSGPTGRGGGGGMQSPGGTQIVVQGDMGRREADRVRDIASGAAQDEMDFR